MLIYDAFGNAVGKTGSTVNEFLYRGEQFDSTLGMYYLRARYYIPKTGRFLTADKWEPAASRPCGCSTSLTPGGAEFDKVVSRALQHALSVPAPARSALADSLQEGLRRLTHFEPYAFALSNPIMWSDPSGQDATGAALQEGYEVTVGAHALEHLTEMAASGYLEGLTEQDVTDAVEEAIREVVQPGSPVGQWYADFMLYVDQRIPVFWRTFVLSDAMVVISTLYPVRWQ